MYYKNLTAYAEKIELDKNQKVNPINLRNVNVLLLDEDNFKKWKKTRIIEL